MSFLEKAKELFTSPTSKKRAAEGLDIWLPIALFGVVIFLILPVHTFLLDTACLLYTSDAADE